jgi:hypothetical protein
MPAGPVRAGQALALDALDPAGAVAIRGLRIVSPPEVARARAGYDALLRRARFVGAWQFSERPYHPVRPGRAEDLGAFSFRRTYRLDVRYRSARGGYLAIAEPKGTILSYRRVGHGLGEATLEFAGVSDRLRLIASGAAVRGWALAARAADEAQTAPRIAARSFSAPAPGETSGTSAAFARPRRVAVLNVAYSESWGGSPERRHFPTALGTNAWLTDGQRGPFRVANRQTPLFHAAYAVGLLVLALAAFASLPMRRRRPSERPRST